VIIQIEPWIDNEELLQLKRVIESTYVTEGAITTEFEEKIKLLTGARHAIAMANGTLALFACLKSLGIRPGDEVIVPDMTFIASANAVIMAGATPIFCDVLSDTYCIDVNAARALVTKNTKAIMPVHLYGQAADMAAVMAFAKELKLFVVEDAAQGVGVKFLGKHVGTFGDLGILSFYGNKTITCGEGGVVLTDNDDLAKACYRLKNHGRERKGIFIHEEIGFNFSFTEMQAAIGVAQLNKLDRIISRKKEIHDFYVSELLGLDGFSPCYIDSRVEPVYWFTSFETDLLEKLSASLSKQGIQTRRFFYPLHMQPCYQKNIEISKVNARQFPRTETIFNNGISLPSSYHLTNNEQETVIEAIKDFYL
jgi:perosamine synthetase